jgi:hypothetical protein
MGSITLVSLNSIKNCVAESCAFILNNGKLTFQGPRYLITVFISATLLHSVHYII